MGFHVKNRVGPRFLKKENPTRFIADDTSYSIRFFQRVLIVIGKYTARLSIARLNRWADLVLYWFLSFFFLSLSFSLSYSRREMVGPTYLSSLENVIIEFGVSWNRFGSALVTPSQTDTRPRLKVLESVLSDQRSLINLEIESRRRKSRAVPIDRIQKGYKEREKESERERDVDSTGWESCKDRRRES